MTQGIHQISSLTIKLTWTTTCKSNVKGLSMGRMDPFQSAFAMKPFVAYSSKCNCTY